MTSTALVTTGLTALSAGVVGLFAAGHAASWGAFKDSPFEGFRIGSYARTLALGAVIAGLLSLWLPVTSAASAAVLVGVTYALERLATEWWKSIVREDDQAAYSIPMRLGLFGRPVERRVARYSVGVVVVAIVAAGLTGLGLAQGQMGLPWWVAVPLVGSAGGWATAVGGAWKDAPVEGFSFWKFLRSPAVATAWALPLAGITSRWPVLLLAAAGYAVVSIETYKTFFTRGRPPGKFAGKPVHDWLPRLRGALATQNAVWWVAFAALLTLAAAGPDARGPGAMVSRVFLGCVAAVAVPVSAGVRRHGRDQLAGAAALARDAAAAGTGSTPLVPPGHRG